jgi:hypothetical protein
MLLGALSSLRYEGSHEAFSSVPRLPALSFLQRINGGSPPEADKSCPLRIPFDRLRAAVSPIDTP